MASKHHVIVLGLGGMGSAALCHLAERGVKVLGIERFRPPHARGSSHGQSRVIRQCYFEGPAYVPLLLRAYELWARMEQDTGSRLLHLCGGLMMGDAASEVVAGSLRSAREHSLPHEMLDAREIRRRYPAFEPPEEVVALFEPRAGVVFPERAIEAHLQSALRSGAEVRYDEPVLDWESGVERVVVRTERGVYEADHLVITPGPWAPDLLAGLGLPLRVERQVLYWFHPKGGVDAFLPDRFPVYIWQQDEMAQPYGFPALDGKSGGVKVSFFRSPRTSLCSPATVDREVSREEVEMMRASVRRYCPSLDGAFLKAETCMYTLTPDLHFIIGRHPVHRRVSLAAGFSGHGYKFCSVVGEMLADLALKGTTRFDIAMFSPSRFAKVNAATPKGGISEHDPLS